MKANSGLHTGLLKIQTIFLRVQTLWTMSAWGHAHCCGESVPVPSHLLVKNVFLIPNLSLPPLWSCLPFPWVLSLLTRSERSAVLQLWIIIMTINVSVNHRLVLIKLQTPWFWPTNELFYENDLVVDCNEHAFYLSSVLNFRAISGMQILY